MAFKTFKDWPDDLMLDEYLVVGDTVDKEMFDHFLDVLPPVYYSLGLLNVGGPVDLAVDEQGEIKHTYITFVKDGDEYVFKGACFKGESINRNINLEPSNDTKTYDLYEQKGLSAVELREGYRAVTGLDNDSEMTDDEIYLYMLEALKDEQDSVDNLIDNAKERSSNFAGNSFEDRPLELD